MRRAPVINTMLCYFTAFLRQKASHEGNRYEIIHGKTNLQDTESSGGQDRVFAALLQKKHDYVLYHTVGITRAITEGDKYPQHNSLHTHTL